MGRNIKTNFSYPRGNFPRLCLIGNSNVGKSSLTKLLLSHPKWYKGKVGKTPGSTVRLTIINDPKLNYHVIDLPGFGRMTRLSRTSEEFIQNQILKYLRLDRDNIFLTLLVIAMDRLKDELEKWYFKNEETIPLSIEFIQYFIKNEIPCLIILNKSDKLNKYQRDDIKKTADDDLRQDRDHFPSEARRRICKDNRFFLSKDVSMIVRVGVCVEIVPRNCEHD